MKSKMVFTKQPIKKENFPKLMINKDQDLIILTYRPSRDRDYVGIVIWTSEFRKTELGDYSDKWRSACFTNFYGTIRLTGD